MHPLFDLRGRHALITGGARGIGKCVTRILAEAGVDVAIVDIDEAGAEATAADLASRFDVKAIGIGCDVTRSERVNAMVDRVWEASAAWTSRSTTPESPGTPRRSRCPTGTGST